MNTIKLRALLKAAGPGPWKHCTGLWSAFDEKDRWVFHDAGRDNAQLIVEMRNCLPALLDRLDKLESRNKLLELVYQAKLGSKELDEALAALESE